MSDKEGILHQLTSMAKGYAEFLKGKLPFLESERAKLEVTDHRKEVCNNCWHQGKFAGIRYCKECLCATDVKTLVENEKCPKGKW